MSSLQDQLLKAGLVDEKKVAQAKRDKNRKDNLTRKSKNKGRVEPSSRQQARDKKAQLDRELNQKRQDAVNLRELAAQVKQLIDKNRQDRNQGELPYSFVYKRKVKKIFVTEAQKKQLARGDLVIATHVAKEGRKFDLVPGPVGKKIAQRDASFIVEFEQPVESDKTDDTYAAYQVPDDLIW